MLLTNGIEKSNRLQLIVPYSNSEIDLTTDLTPQIFDSQIKISD